MKALIPNSKPTTSQLQEPSQPNMLDPDRLGPSLSGSCSPVGLEVALCWGIPWGFRGRGLRKGSLRIRGVKGAIRLVLIGLLGCVQAQGEGL